MSKCPQCGTVAQHPRYEITRGENIKEMSTRVRCVTCMHTFYPTQERWCYVHAGDDVFKVVGPFESQQMADLHASERLGYGRNWITCKIEVPDWRVDPVEEIITRPVMRINDPLGGT